MNEWNKLRLHRPFTLSKRRRSTKKKDFVICVQACSDVCIIAMCIPYNFNLQVIV